MRPAEIAKLDDLLDVVTAADLSEAEIRVGEWRLHVCRERSGQISLEENVPAIADVVSREPEPSEIRAPMVGFFRAPEPPLEPADSIEAGDTVGAISALGLDNEVRAEAAGAVAEVNVQDGEPVQFGQVLYTLRPVEVAT